MFLSSAPPTCPNYMLRQSIFAVAHNFSSNKTEYCSVRPLSMRASTSAVTDVTSCFRGNAAASLLFGRRACAWRFVAWRCMVQKATMLPTGRRRPLPPRAGPRWPRARPPRRPGPGCRSTFVVCSGRGASLGRAPRSKPSAIQHKVGRQCISRAMHLFHRNFHGGDLVIQSGNSASSASFFVVLSGARAARRSTSPLGGKAGVAGAQPP